MSIEYELEEKELIESFISKTYLPNIFNKEKNKNWVLGEGIEFIIRPQCNQKCQYCYITQYGDKLYPIETRVSSEKILINLEIILNWLIDNKIFIPRFELFAGDLFGDSLYYKIIDIYKKVYSKINQTEHFNNIKKWGKIEIITPTNGFYFQFDEHQQKLKEYTVEVEEKYGIILGMSWSTDGLYASSTRENTAKNIEIEQSYYDKVFSFIKEMHYGIHPMISQESIKNSIKNLDWWVSMYEKYNMAESCKSDIYPCMLEVRNYYWTDQDIHDFTKLIRHMWDIKMQKNHNSTKKMARHLLVGDGEGDSLPRLRFYDICKLHKDTKTEEEDMSCGMSAILRINLMDMTLPICHRVTYPQFRGGTFEIKENHIIGIIPSDGLSGYLQLKTLSPKFFIKCNKCKYRPFCLQGCFGAQYEYSGEILSPIPAVCNLQKAKIDTLLELYNTYGIIQEGIESNLFDDEEFKRQIIKLSIEKGYFNG